MSTLVLGIGNLLMGDEAVGVHVARALAGRPLPAGVTVVDGGTGGFHLLSCLTDFDPVVIVDATMDGRGAGSVSMTEPRYASDFPRSLTAHDIGLRDLIESAALLAPLPRVFLVTISIDAIQEMQTSLSAEVESAIAPATELVSSLIAARAWQQQLQFGSTIRLPALSEVEGKPDPTTDSSGMPAAQPEATMGQTDDHSPPSHHRSAGARSRLASAPAPRARGVRPVALSPRNRAGSR